MSVANNVRRTFVQPAKKMSISKKLYENVWGKSTIFYISYVLAGAVVLEAVYGGVTNYIWESVNYGVRKFRLISSSSNIENDDFLFDY
jgi:hypothetical protein